MLAPFVETLDAYGFEWADDNVGLRLEVIPWPSGDGVDVRIEHGNVETHHYSNAELYALSLCVDQATTAGKLKWGHTEDNPAPGMWKKLRAWFLPRRSRSRR